MYCKWNCMFVLIMCIFQLFFSMKEIYSYRKYSTKKDKAGEKIYDYDYDYEMLLLGHKEI